MIEAIPPIERFMPKFVVNEETDCWEWIAYKDYDGYGRFKVSGSSVYAHRWSYEYFVGEIPKELEIDHLCRVRHCVNPDHMEPTNHRTNVMRGIGFGAINGKKTHCPQGHPYDKENTYVHYSNRERLPYRQCKQCRRDANNARWKRKRDELSKL